MYTYTYTCTYTGVVYCPDTLGLGTAYTAQIHLSYTYTYTGGGFRYCPDTLVLYLYLCWGGLGTVWVHVPREGGYVPIPIPGGEPVPVLTLFGHKYRHRYRYRRKHKSPRAARGGEV